MARTPRWTPPSRPFTLADVAPLGVTSTMLATAKDRERITRLVQGVYVATEDLAKEPVARHLQLAFAVQLRMPSAIASHHTSALASDLDLADPVAAALTPPTFTVPPDSGLRSGPTAAARLHVRALPVRHCITLPSDLNVTSLARTAVDVAATAQLPEALVPLDAFVRMELREVVGSSRVRAAYSQPRRLAAAREPLLEATRAASTQFTRSWLETVCPRADPRRESALESLSFGHMELAGLPTPQLQVRVVTPIGEFFVDFMWPGHWVIGEADGDLKYRDDPDALLREKRRQEALEQMGYIVVRWSYKELMRNPGAVLARIRAALARRA